MVTESPILPSEGELARLSSNASKTMLRGNSIKTVPHKLQKSLDLYNEPSNSPLLHSWVDALHPNMNFKFKKQDYKLVTYRRSIPLTTMSQEVYGTTSLWWLILRVNGVMHPDELNDGERLKVPSLDAIKSKVLPAIESKKGSVVTV